MNKRMITAVLIFTLTISCTACSLGHRSETAIALKQTYGLTAGHRAKGNDTWMIVSTDNPAANDPMEWAADYYREYGDEGSLIWILNNANDTTTVIRNDSSEELLLYVQQMEGTDEESLKNGEVYRGKILSAHYIYFDENGEQAVRNTISDKRNSVIFI